MTNAEIRAKVNEIKLRWIKRRWLKRQEKRRLDNDEINWITSNGARIPLKNGEPINEAGKNIFGESLSPEVRTLLGTEHKGVKGTAAINKLLEERNGHVKSAFRRNEIGSIDLVWGNDDFGLQHIIKRRNEEGFDGESFLFEIPNIIRHGKIKRISESRFEISHQDNAVAISSELRRDKVTFVLTAYERY